MLLRLSLLLLLRLGGEWGPSPVPPESPRCPVPIPPAGGVPGTGAPAGWGPARLRKACPTPGSSPPAAAGPLSGKEPCSCPALVPGG